MPEPEALLPPPHAGDHDDVSMWIDEQIWGHRLWDAESPWLLFLEFLTVAEACHRDERLLDERGEYYPLLFTPRKRMYLRNILFNNEVIGRIAADHASSSSAWAEWLEWMENKAQAVPSRDFSYLKTRFHSFHDFAALVAMLRGTAVESGRNKRWSSRFVFPFGPSAIYEDLNKLGGREYIYFGRTGELLYLMLCRASRSPELRCHLAALFESRNPWSRLVALLQPELDDDSSRRGKSYLPYRYHSSFDRFAEDWLKLFELDLPSFDILPHLVTLGALHVLLYQITVAAELCGDAARPSFVCEVVAPRKTFVRELSIASFQRNDMLPAKAVRVAISRVEQSTEWVEATVAPGGFARCRRLLEREVRWGGDGDYGGAADPAALIAELRAAALKRHRQHVGNVHGKYGREIGLVSRRGTTKLRYAPGDGLLKTLLLANVDRRLEFGEFLACLYERYGFVIGDREAEGELDDSEFDKKAFQANARRLEERLRSLGMLKRLSDGCAYVENPYGMRPR